MRFPHLITLASAAAVAAADVVSAAGNLATATLNTKSSGTLTTQSSVQSSLVGVVEFENVGYIGYYYDVKSISNADDSDCSCELSTAFTVFEGSNSPLNEELSVHFRGPLSLKQFAFYLANDSSSGTWSRHAYYNATQQTADNVTFLNNGGTASSCMGNALSYSPTNGTGYSDDSQILEADNYIEDDDEYVIYSNVSCPSSGFDKSCGVYRDGIPAYHGFGGTTKMFLFEFTMPETSSDNDNVTYPNMPAIWFLNAKIPRTGQYASDGNCSCWNSGCGELDVFEVVNKTYPTRFAATIHDYQGSGDINTGMAASGYLTRSYTSTMKGAVRFGSDGTISIFMLDDIVFDDEIDTSLVSTWLSGSGTENVKVLSTVTMDTSTTSATATSTSSSKKSGGSRALILGWLAGLIAMAGLAFIYL